ncbi:preprotein translocase subunit SecG [Pseudooceanicola sp. CBS1P-1]|uniref:Protein-export membrane protein SecG n=1 Tax=Pseudooceanicola albus TaxID=2692189 RepID=A0A6L7FZ18_9RHOB|nr:MULTISPECIES: preprotein translocase subunit SecG [Pseudooceanicola]MBT9383151.1 preprotein translocase subunit SecG [Pseudooceanicola endophyticus]MXN16526.1 preprotein translocase subunit SecG [Pseudooceanicola albus]
MQNIVLIIHLILALSLIGVVLLQRSEGGGLGMGSGGGGAMTGRAAASALSKVTWGLAAAFIITSLALTILAAQKSAGSSVLDRIGNAPAASAPAGDDSSSDTTLPGGSLLPPPAGSSDGNDLTPSAN